MPEPTNPPRGRPARLALAGALGLVLIALSAGPETLVSETSGNRYLGWLASGLLPYLLGLWLAPKVAYRRRDALIFLTLGFSAMPSALLFVTIIWRIAALPHRDWPLRGELPEPTPESPVTPPRPSRPAWAYDVTEVR